ncbi:cytochrome ubiquinol oxidase subunit I [Pelagibius litoralis]|uniref:Cytochrome ubiquinol oxidase subunit I n=1 Tax=Pelagibius litoralis TaxID=374515 RepID=A0A967EVE8_9PROT|nr:cytochrome ubiquinol oxidase subunit I [Pelagibius litoralis]NIA68402.1 cytochrome ubiquinol oxidase subunit I [Pelagibius litoralis]
MSDFFDATVLARAQFAFTVAFHIVFPSFTIGLASYLVVLEGLWLAKKQDVYLRLYKYWSKIFALSFGMGVVSGIVMSYQFGTNWGPFSDMTGPVLGPLLGYEVLTAFFLEAGFLGVMLFGMNRVGPKLHFFSTLMVGVGTLFSAFWILSANSWMQTPQGFAIENGQFVPVDWWLIVFNPSFPYRLVHMVLAAYLTTAFVVAAVGAYHLLKDKQNKAAQIMFSMAMWMALLVAPLQLVAGDLHGLNTLEHQPAKVAAMEGHWETRRGAPLVLFGLPDMAAEVTHFEVAIPKLGSLILTHEWDGEVQGLKDWPPEDRPNAAIVFWSFRIMVGLGLLMILVGGLSLFMRWRGRLYDQPWFLRLALVMGPSGFVAVLAGWFTTEVGRQPYLVYGLLRTSDGVSPIDALAVGTSLAAFAVVYFVVFGAGIYYLLRLMRQPPRADEPGPQGDAPLRAAGIASVPPPRPAE